MFPKPNRPSPIQLVWPSPAGLLCTLLALGCGGATSIKNDAFKPDTTDTNASGERGNPADDSPSNALLTNTLPARVQDGTAWLELPVPGEGSLQALVSASDSVYALRRHSVAEPNGGKVVPEYRNELFATSDGVNWETIPLVTLDPNQGFRGMAWGNGVFVLAGGSDLLLSADARTWTAPMQPPGSVGDFTQVHFQNGRFFALSTLRRIITSTDGESWSLVDMIETVQQTGVAYGNDVFLMTGSGPIQRSSNGLTWRGIELSCALPGTCITAPDGQSFQHLRTPPVFSEGTFYAGSLRSQDGLDWEASDALSVDGRVADWLFHYGDGEVSLWTQSREPLRVSLLSAGTSAEHLAEGASCRTTDCVQLNEALYLIP